VGIGTCIKDHSELFVKAKTTSYSPMLSMKEDETYDLLRAIKWVSQMELDRDTFELDAKVVVDNFNNPSKNLSYFGFIFSDCI
jgi:hypothetical protein